MVNTVTKLYILSVIFGWAAFGLGVISISSANWKYFSSESFHGLWLNCTSAENCISICQFDNLTSLNAFLRYMFSFFKTTDMFRFYLVF